MSLCQSHSCSQCCLEAKIKRLDKQRAYIKDSKRIIENAILLKYRTNDLSGIIEDRKFIKELDELDRKICEEYKV